VGAKLYAQWNVSRESGGYGISTFAATCGYQLSDIALYFGTTE